MQGMLIKLAVKRQIQRVRRERRRQNKLKYLRNDHILYERRPKADETFWDWYEY